MNIEDNKEEIKKEIKKIIQENGGILDRKLKLKVTSIFEKKLKESADNEWQLAVPFEISEEKKNKIAAALSINPELIHMVIDPALIGGFNLRSKSKLIDASVSGHITSLTHTLYEGSR
jgi:F0F1-type ATP synthase delta subunit